jgi:hypothetical protein
LEEFNAGGVGNKLHIMQAAKAYRVISPSWLPPETKPKKIELCVAGETCGALRAPAQQVIRAPGFVCAVV